MKKSIINTIFMDAIPKTHLFILFGRKQKVEFWRKRSFLDTYKICITSSFGL